MKLKAVLCLATALCLPVALAGCNDEGVGAFVAGAKESRPLRPEMIKLMADKGMRKEDPILIRTFKEENTLEVWKRNNKGEFAFLRSYQMCSWGGTLGPKIREGDKQSPEGFYTVTPSRMNPNSQFFLAFDVGYPNAFDRAYGRTGAAVMVHGNCTASAGCFVMTDEQVQEIYGLAREALNAGQPSFQVQAFPFRMTAANMAKHRRNPNMAFWRNIKEGYDHFELTRLEPKVDVCDRKYVFDAKPTSSDSTTFNAASACPSYAMPEHIASLVKAKQQADDTEFKTIVAELDAKEKAAADAALAAKMDAARPKPKETNMLASILGSKPAETPAAATAVPATAAAGVPLPKANPRAPARPAPLLAVASADPATTAPATAGKSDSDLIGNLLSFVAPSSQPVPPAVPEPVAAVPPVAKTDAAAKSDAALKAPAAKPLSTAAAKAQAPAAKPAVQPIDPPAPPKAAATAQPSWWQKIVPFGG